MACETNKSTMQLVAGHASRPHYIYIYLLMYAMCRRYNPWFVDQNAAAPVAQKSVCGMQHLQWYLPWKFAVCRQWAVDYLRISLHRSRFTTKCLQAAFCELIDTQTYTTHWYISMSFNRLARATFFFFWIFVTMENYDVATNDQRQFCECVISLVRCAMTDNEIGNWPWWKWKQFFFIWLWTSDRAIGRKAYSVHTHTQSASRTIACATCIAVCRQSS